MVTEEEEDIHALVLQDADLVQEIIEGADLKIILFIANQVIQNLAIANL
jgi:hypothetical protein